MGHDTATRYAYCSLQNCTIKSPAPIVLRDRHRRLCLTCSRAPIGHLFDVPISDPNPEHVEREVCQCPDSVWLCQPCGRTIRSADHDYLRVWRWRTQYGEVLGGLGTGIGDGDRGVPCGREQACVVAKEREQEVDCDAEDAREAELGSTPTSQHSAWGGRNRPGNLSTSTLNVIYAPESERRTPSPALGPGYARHEIEGIGGVVKRKLLCMVRVGACVPEWEDEISKGVLLGREVDGRVRSWCGWCWRVIPSEKDREGLGSGTPVPGK